MRRDLAFLFLAALSIPACTAAQGAGGAKCDADNAGLKLPSGFCVTVFAESLSGVRHMVVAPNGDVFASRQGRGGGVVALRDSNRDGRADVRETVATGFASSEVALFDGHLYTEASPAQAGPPAAGATAPTIAIVRYRLKPGELTASGPADTIVQDLPSLPGHRTRNFTITSDGVMYVNIGSPTNACQERDRSPGAPGLNPCTALETRAGIWRFDARKQHQTPSAANHFARGIRNAVGVAINPVDGRLWATQHGRDQLGDWKSALGMDTAALVRYNAENPAEELLQVNQNNRPASPGFGAGIRRRRKEDGRLCEQEGAGGRLPGALGAQWTAFLHGICLSGSLQERRVRRVPWFLEPRPRIASGLQRRLSAAQRRQGRG